MIREHRTDFAALVPLRIEHEVVDDQLAATVEQIGERLFAVGAVKHVVFFDLLPRKFLPRASQLVAQTAEFFLFREKFLPCLDPLIR